MTRERAAELWPIIRAYGEGKDFQYRTAGSSLDWISTNDNFMGEHCDSLEYRIKPEPKKRPMTRGEVLYMVTTTPGMVIRELGDTEIGCAAVAYCGPYIPEKLEYAIIDASGEPIDGWHKFEKECEA